MVKMKSKSKSLGLPDDVEFAESYTGPSFNDGVTIVGKYCRSCMKRNDCDMNTNLRRAMGENFPYWNDSFVAVRVSPERRGLDEWGLSSIMVFCREYESSQLRLNGIDSGFCDGVERLIAIIDAQRAENLRTCVQ